MVTCSALKVLMAWCFSTRASVATGMNTHPCVVSGMTHGSRVTPYVDVDLGQHWFRYRLVAYSTPSLPPNQCWLILNWTHRNKLHWNLNKRASVFFPWKCILKCRLEIAWSFVQDTNVLIHLMNNRSWRLCFTNQFLRRNDVSMS